MQLSKSDYMIYLKHPAWLWLKKNEPHKIPPTDELTQSKFDNGHEFEEIAEKLFEDSIKLSFNNYAEYLTMGPRTKDALNSGHKVILQAKFEYENLACICDVVELNEDGSINLYEIKSSTKLKIEHLYDLAFQKYVLINAGLKVNSINLIHVNNRFIKNGEIDPKLITVSLDITGEVNDLADFTIKHIKQANKVMNLGKCPDMSPAFCRLGSFDDYMQIYRFNNVLGEDSIYNLISIDAKLVKKFEENNIEKLSQITSDLIFNPKQVRQVNAILKDEVIIQKDSIKKFLDLFKYPLYFLDYETLMSAVPYFDGTSPYSQIPFQFSIHKIDKPGGKLEHYSYLHADQSNPTTELSKKLIEYLGESGTILTWNMSFEKKCNTLLAKLNPDLKTKILKINQRINDLMIPFWEGYYVNRNFFGSASIKKVLPVVVPELSYKELDISDGGNAQRIWMDTILKSKNEEQKDKILEDLIKYCGLDTLAMVEIYNHLIKTINE